MSRVHCRYEIESTTRWSVDAALLVGVAISTEQVLRIPVGSLDERGRRVPVSVVAVCRRRQRPERKSVSVWTAINAGSCRWWAGEATSLSTGQCMSCSRRYCVWWTTQWRTLSSQHWSLLRVVKFSWFVWLYCYLEHSWDLGLRYIDSVFGLLPSWTILYVYVVCIIFFVTFVFIKNILENLLCEEFFWFSKMLLTCDTSSYNSRISVAEGRSWYLYAVW